jgi:hypothetical protein
MCVCACRKRWQPAAGSGFCAHAQLWQHAVCRTGALAPRQRLLAAIACLQRLRVHSSGSCFVVTCRAGMLGHVLACSQLWQLFVVAEQAFGVSFSAQHEPHQSVSCMSWCSGHCTTVPCVFPVLCHPILAYVYGVVFWWFLSQGALLLPVLAGYISGPGDCIRGSWHLCCYCHALHHRHTHAESTRQHSGRQQYKQQQMAIWGWHNVNISSGRE